MTGLKSGSRGRLTLRRVLLAWLVMTLVAVAATLAVGERMRRGVFDSWQEARPRDLSATDVRVVMIDDYSIGMLGPWPWTRYHLARLTEELNKRRAKVIAFDILFPEHDRVEPATFVALYPELSAGTAAELQALEPLDQAFGRVIGMAPVVLAHAGVAKAPEGQLPLYDAPISGKLPPGAKSWPAEMAAIPELDDVALGNGLINVPPDSDGVIRSVPLVLRAGGKPRPGFALEIARIATDAEKIGVTPYSVNLPGHSAPIDRSGRMRLHFGKFPAEKIISAARLFDTEQPLPKDIFAGKPVLIGLSAEATFDVAATPLASQEFGPLVQAQAVDSILRNGWLVRPPWAGTAEWIVAGLLALLALGNAYFGKAYRVLLAVIFAALPIGSWIMFASKATLLDPARPLLVGTGAVAGVAMGLFAVARIERERLREALVLERVVAAETEGELQAARTIQLGMVPPRERLRHLDPRLDLDALLEPAKSIGGDYYDAMKIGDNEVGFAIADVTGKGVPAALYMAMSKALTSAALSRMQADPATMLAAINTELLKDSGDTMSVTILLGIIDLGTGLVRMACAGHEDPLILSDNGELRLVRLEGGLPLCVVDQPYPLETIQLKVGETLLLVTDGVTEAQNAKDQLFGRDRVLAAGLAKKSGSTDVINAIRKMVRDFEGGAEATDDLTVMALRYLGKS